MNQVLVRVEEEDRDLFPGDPEGLAEDISRRRDPLFDVVDFCQMVVQFIAVLGNPHTPPHATK